MTALDALLGCAGRWSGTNCLQDPNTGSPDRSLSDATVMPLLDGRFARLDYTWVYQGAKKEGSILIGYETDSGEATAHWIDSWHMGGKVMACRGRVEPDGAISVRGSYSVPSGPDWGWRITITPQARSLRMMMYNVSPEGEEYLGVEADYRPAS